MDGRSLILVAGLLLYAAVFAFSLVFPFEANGEWLFPLLALANALLVGFPKGALSPPGLVSDGPSWN